MLGVSLQTWTGKRAGRGRCTIFMHDGSRVTIDPRTPTMRKGVYSLHAWPRSRDHRPSHPNNTRTEHGAGGGGEEESESDRTRLTINRRRF